MRTVGIILIVNGLGVFGYWASQGAHFITLYEVPKTTVEEDAFGDKVERTKMVEQFRFGLMPDKPYDGALTLGGGPLGVGIALVVASFVVGNKDEDTTPSPTRT